MANLSTLLGASYTGNTGPQGATGNTGPQGPVGPKSITISAPGSSEDVTLFYTTQELTITSARAIITGSSTPSTRYYIYSGSTRGSAASTHINASVVGTSGTDSIISTAVIPANRWVWLTTDQTAGTVTSLTVSLFFA